MYVFGAFLVFTGIKMFVDKDKDEEIDTQNHPVVRFANRYFKVHPHFVGSKFFVTIDGVKKLGGIAEKYNVSVSNLKKWNNLGNSKIKTGQVLKSDIVKIFYHGKNLLFNIRSG